MKKFLSVFTVLLLLLLLPLPLFAEINLLSPVEGEFANRQMLVIDNSSGGDFFYSIDGADPETFGFAYDGPVLIDLDGPVELKITKSGIFKDNLGKVHAAVCPECGYIEFYLDDTSKIKK